MTYDSYMHIISLVCGETGVSENELLSPCRAAHITEARHITLYLIRRKTTLSLREIGRLFHRDHAAVIHACRRVEAERKVYAEMERKVREMEEGVG